MTCPLIVTSPQVWRKKIKPMTQLDFLLSLLKGNFETLWAREGRDPRHLGSRAAAAVPSMTQGQGQVCVTLFLGYPPHHGSCKTLSELSLTRNAQLSFTEPGSDPPPMR